MSCLCFPGAIVGTKKVSLSLSLSLYQTSVLLLSVEGINVRQHAQLQPTPARRVSVLLPEVVSRLRRVGQLRAGKRQLDWKSGLK